MSVGKVYALCLRFTVDPDLAEKLTAEVFLTAWRNISFFREGTLFSSWLTGIATYTTLEWIRNNGGTWSNLNQQKLKHAKSSLNKENTDPFEIKIQSLPDKERFVFVLHDIEKYTDVEVADLLSIFTEDVKAILYNAYDLLKSPGEITDGKAYISKHLSSLSHIIQPENDIWKNVFPTINKEQTPISKNLDGNPKETEEETETEKKKKKFGFLSWKKK
jgi:RNA polymerase sigma-70 factor, ECF subfamily